MTAADTFLTLDTALVGRAREQRMLSGLLTEVGVRGAALVLRGEPGIGKSALVGETMRAGAGRGMLVQTVPACRCVRTFRVYRVMIRPRSSMVRSAAAIFSMSSGLGGFIGLMGLMMK
jgi:hypothetical protein